MIDPLEQKFDNAAPNQPPNIPHNHSSAYAIAALVLGILATALCCIPILPTLCAILGLVFVGKARKQEPILKNGMVTAALVLNICGLILSLLCLLYWLWYVCIFLQMLARPQYKETPAIPKYQGKPAQQWIARLHIW